MYPTFDTTNFRSYCDELSDRDKDLRKIIKQYDYPPMWTRPDTFQTLILTILEQQVSLASAFAAFRQLRKKIGYVTPEKILSQSDEELRSCYFSRQKIGYAKGLARAVISKELKLKKLHNADETNIRVELKRIKGIGDWTVDVYLMHALQHTDLFPLGDLALVNSLKEVKKLPITVSREKLQAIAEPWRPYRTIASMILWHSYIQKRGIKIES